MELLNSLAQEKQATPAQISMAWMLCKKPYIVPIPGSRKPDRLRENLGAAGIQLTDEEIRKIDEISGKADLPVFGGSKANK